MSALVEWASAVAGGVALWACGAVFFDFVHWLLHLMLRSRWRVLRALAHPHSVHHEWLDRSLAIHPEHRIANVWCHVVPEYLTQLAFSMVAWTVLPGAIIAMCVGLQTLTFAGLLAYGGSDINHRPVEILDAYRPSWIPFPEYHALHHVYPDAHFSSYSKLVDWLVGGGAQLRGRRFALRDAGDRIGRALCEVLEREGADVVDVAEDADAAGCDVLVLCAPPADASAVIEAFIEATRSRRLPPEVWHLHSDTPAGTARHYYRDARVLYRVLCVPAELHSDAVARRVARDLVFWVRRGACFVKVGRPAAAWRELRLFRKRDPLPPPGVDWRGPRRCRALAGTPQRPAAASGA